MPTRHLSSKIRMHGERVPIAIDLFSGCGGLTQGLKDAGFAVVAAVEIDDVAAETYGENHPEVRVWRDDITQLCPGDVMGALRLQPGDLDLLAGCPPCQGFSSMTTRNGARNVNDPRNDLVLDFLVWVSAFQPKAVMMENVPGLATDVRLGLLIGELERMDYRPIWDVLNAGDYGVPQRRRRLILMGVRGYEVEFAPRDPLRRTVRDAIATLQSSGKSGDPLHDVNERRSPRVARLIRSIPADGGSRTDLSKRSQLKCHKKCDGFKDVYGRMAWDDLGPTITSGCFNPSKGRFLHPKEHRTITLREAAALQSFPPTYHFSLKRGKTGAAWMIGNALPPEFVRRHASQLYGCLIGQSNPME